MKNLLPCLHCRKSFVYYVRANPLAVDAEAALWMWKIHDSVNTKLGKATLSFSKLTRRFQAFPTIVNLDMLFSILFVCILPLKTSAELVGLQDAARLGKVLYDCFASCTFGSLAILNEECADQEYSQILMFYVDKYNQFKDGKTPETAESIEKRYSVVSASYADDPPPAAAEGGVTHRRPPSLAGQRRRHGAAYYTGAGPTMMSGIDVTQMHSYQSHQPHHRPPAHRMRRFVP